jgi:hypothetical protein
VCHASLAGRSQSGSSRTAAAYAPRRSPLVVLARGRVWGWPLILPSRPSSHVLAPLTPLAHSTQRIKASGPLTTAEILECASRSFKDKHFHGKPARWDERWWRRLVARHPKHALLFKPQRVAETGGDTPAQALGRSKMLLKALADAGVKLQLDEASVRPSASDARPHPLPAPSTSHHPWAVRQL